MVYPTIIDPLVVATTAAEEVICLWPSRVQASVMLLSEAAVGVVTITEVVAWVSTQCIQVGRWEPRSTAV